MTGRFVLYVGGDGCKTRSSSSGGFVSSLTEVLPPQAENMVIKSRRLDEENPCPYYSPVPW